MERVSGVNVVRFLRLALLTMIVSAIGSSRSVSAAPVIPAKPSSEIRSESNGLWLLIDGIKTPAFAGVVYQNTEGDTHIRAYTNSQHLLFRGLDDEVFGGRGHGRRLAEMGVRAIRVYELPVENPEDVGQVKEIFRRLN